MEISVGGRQFQFGHALEKVDEFVFAAVHRERDDYTIQTQFGFSRFDQYTYQALWRQIKSKCNVGQIISNVDLLLFLVV